MEEAQVVGQETAPAGQEIPVSVPSLADVLRFSVPLALGMLTMALLSIVDALFVGRLGIAHLGALGMAGIFYFTGLVLFMGLMRNSITFMARAYGEGNPGRIGEMLAQYQWLALLGLPILGLASLTFPWVMGWSGIDPTVTHFGKIYLYIRIWDIPLALTLILYASLYQSLGNSRFPMLVQWSVLILNVGLNYVLVFGKAGFPALGIAGAALGTVIAQICGAILIVGATHLGDLPARYRLRVLGRPRWRLMRQVLAVGIPQGLGDFVEIASFMGFFLIVGRLGQAPLAANHIGVQTTHLLFIPGFALGIAASSYMGRFIGAGAPDVALHAVRQVLKIGVIYMGLLGIPLWFFGGLIATAFTDDPQVIALAAAIFKIMAIYQVFDGMGMIARGALNGAGDTRYPTAALTLAALLVFLPAAWALSLWVQPGVAGAWIGALIYFVVLGPIMLLRLERGAWRNIRIKVGA